MKKAKLWAHATYEMVEHDDFSRRLNLPAYVRAENYDYIHQRCENMEAENARLKAEVERLTVADDAVKAYHEGDVNGFLTLCAIWHAAKEGKQP